jgi:oligopeptide transport system substrate-binding protein
VTGPYLGVQMLAFNVVDPPFANNRNLRLALSMAVDRNILVKLTQGMNPAAYAIVPPLPGYTPQLPDWASWSDEKRHAEARRLYAAAGYSKAHPLQVQLDYPTDDNNRDLMTALAAMWRINLGADVEPYNEEFRVLQQNLLLHKPVLFWNSWIGDFPDPFTFVQLAQKDNPQNYGQFNDPRFEALLTAAANEPDNARRYGYFEQAERLLNQEAVFLPMIYYTSRHLIKPYIKGWHYNLQDRIPTRYLHVLEHEGR